MAARVTETRPLMKVLECPVCYTTFKSKIYFCVQGHNVCSDCKPNLDNCPVCREEFTGSRNHLLEEILTSCLLQSCENVDYGCQETLPLVKLEEHQQKCQYRPYKCFVPKEYKCVWKGQYPDILHHVTAEHAASVSESKETLLIDRNFSNAKLGHSDYLFIQQYDELFIYYYKRGPMDALKFSVYYIGPEECALNFFFQLKLQNEDLSKVMIIRSNLFPDTQYESSKPNLIIDYSTAEQFTRYNGHLPYFVSIEKKKNDMM